MLNKGLVSWCLKKQANIALSSTEAEYIALIFAAKEVTWLRILLMELVLLQPNDQHDLIKILEQNTSAQAIQADLSIEREGVASEKDSKHGEESNIFIPLKNNNQGSIALAHNPVFHSRTQYINV